MSSRPWSEDHSSESSSPPAITPFSYFNPDLSTSYFELIKKYLRRPAHQAIFRFKIDNVMKITREYGPTFRVYGMSWRLMAVTHENVKTDHNGEMKFEKKFGLFLHCYGLKGDVDWAAFAKVNFDVRNHIPGKNPLRRRFTHFFYKDEPNFGFYSLLNSEELTNESLGFVKEGALVVEVVVYAEQPLIIPEKQIERPFTINGFVVPDILAHLYTLEDH